MGPSRAPEPVWDDAYDEYNGLAPVEGELLACPECGAYYERWREEPTRFHDYLTFYYRRLDRPPLAGEPLEKARFERWKIDQRLMNARLPDD